MALSPITRVSTDRLLKSNMQRELAATEPLRLAAERGDAVEVKRLLQQPSPVWMQGKYVDGANAFGRQTLF